MRPEVPTTQSPNLTGLIRAEWVRNPMGSRLPTRSGGCRGPDDQTLSKELVMTIVGILVVIILILIVIYLFRRV